MYIAHPTHGAGTWPNRTQPPTAARKTTLNAGQCVRQPGKAEGGTGSPPPPEEKKEGGGGGARKQPTATKPPANTTRGGQPPPPPPDGPKDRTPEEARGDHPAKTGNTKPGTAAHREKGHRNIQIHTTKKKRASSPARERGDGGTGTTRPGTGTPSKKKEKRKKHTPTTQPRKGWAQPRPGPSTHAHTARRNQKRQGASEARTKPHTAQKQAETELEPRTPQTADTRGTTQQTMPKHTHPRPQPGLAGLTKPTPNRKPDPNTNAAQQ